MNKQRLEEWRKEFNGAWRKLGVISEVELKMFSKCLNIAFGKQVAHKDFRKVLREMEE